MRTFTFFLSLLKTSIKASISKRGAFLIETGLMIANNLIFFSMWWIFFRQFEDVAGWKISDMSILMAIATGSLGILQICFGGIKNLANTILNGNLDPFMTQPKNLLIHVISSSSRGKGWGHILTAFILITLSGIATLHNIPLILLCILNGSLVLASMSTIAYSLPFWLGSIGDVSNKYCDALYLFVLYPTNIYSGVLQIIMFTLIPAGIIGYIPVELVRDFSWTGLVIMLTSTGIFVSLTFFVFYTGLKRYESGNKFGIRL